MIKPINKAAEAIEEIQVGERSCQIECYFGRSYHVTHRFRGGIEWLCHDGVFRELPLPIMAGNADSLVPFCDSTTFPTAEAARAFAREVAEREAKR